MKVKRPLLLLFSPIYAAITWTRNRLFDFGVLKSELFNVPVITIGNLNVGGTGKTPHTMWVLELVQNKVKTAVVSRGYGRKTKGYLLANSDSKSQDIGDEPKEILTRFPDTQVAVAEKRVEGISNLLETDDRPEAIILDDAFQHRYVQAGLTLLLSTYKELFTKDILLPGGNLRESKSGYKRADIIIVTKCDKSLSLEKQNNITAQINPLPHQKIGFSYFKYGTPISSTGDEIELPKYFILLTGIAHSDYLTDYLEKQGCSFEHLRYSDHHNFDEKNYEAIAEAGEMFEHKTILTTSKDYSRLDLEHTSLLDFQILQLPISVQFIAGAEEIESEIVSFVLGKKSAI